MMVIRVGAKILFGSSGILLSFDWMHSIQTVRRFSGRPSPPPIMRTISNYALCVRWLCGWSSGLWDGLGLGAGSRRQPSRPSRLDQLLLFRFCFGPGRIRVLMFLCSGLWLLVAEEGADNKPNIIHDGTKLYQPKTKLGEEERADHSNENVRTSSIAVAKPPNR